MSKYRCFSKQPIFSFLLLVSLFVFFPFVYSLSQTGLKESRKRIEQEISGKNQNKAIELQILSRFIDTSKLRRFYPEILNFERDDSIHPDRKTDIVFTGSSTIRKWVSLSSDMAGFNVLNRGFGGSTIPEIIYYSDQLIFRHKPSKIVFYAGENDLACPTCDPKSIVESLKYFSELVTKRLPESHIYFISLKPSPGRMKYWNIMKIINFELDLYCISNKSCTFITIWDDMFDTSGNVRMELFKPDKTHLTAMGYEVLSKKVLEVLKMQNR